MRAFRAALRAQSYDAIIETQGLIKSAAVARLASGPIHGFGRKTAREPCAARLYDATYDFVPQDHKIERYRAVAARALGYGPGALDYGIASPPPPRFAPAQQLLRAPALHRARGQAVVGAGLERARSLARRRGSRLRPALGRRRGGRRAPGASPPALAQALVPPRMSLEDAAGLIGHARVVVGLDTGLMHLAAALRIPVVGLFCDSDPLDAHPRGSGPIAWLGGVGRPPSAQEAIEAVKKIA